MQDTTANPSSMCVVEGTDTYTILTPYLSNHCHTHCLPLQREKNASTTITIENE
jgi:hypothetical protein